MGEIKEVGAGKTSGCGLVDALKRRVFGPRRGASSNSPLDSNLDQDAQKGGSNSYPKRRRGGPEESKAPQKPPPAPAPAPAPAPEKILVTRSPLMSKDGPPPNRYQINAETNLGSASSVVPGRLQKANSISTELDILMAGYGGNNGLVRASSNNMMVFGNLGNISQPVTSGNLNSKEKPPPVAKREEAEEQEGRLCRALSRRLEPEELKALGNGEFKKGRFAEALAYYDLAISLDPGKACYRSNKGAALTGLGQLLEAVEECREAIRMDPSYHRAHHRLGTLYLRLGEGEKALKHYKLSGKEASSQEISKANALQTHLVQCIEARKLKDWETMLKEAKCAFSSGADSALLVFSSEAEALLKLHRHQEADIALSSRPTFDPDASTNFFGASANAYGFQIRAQVDMAAGRFEEAVMAAQRAEQLDSTNKEVISVARRAHELAAARSKGNDLFKAAKFGEACQAYGEGLEQEPLNAILLCNRAACRSKMGKWEKAIEDCNSALNLRPSYAKALLRRADCNAKMEQWEASIHDYEALLREMPGDEEVGKALLEAQVQLKRRRGEDIVVADDIKFSSVPIDISSNDQFQQLVSSPGLSVVLFFKNSGRSSKQLSLISQLCKRYPSLNFLKVDLEENPQISKSEGVSSVPSYNIYKKGSKVKDIDGHNHDMLETSIKFFTS